MPVLISPLALIAIPSLGLTPAHTRAVLLTAIVILVAVTIRIIGNQVVRRAGLEGENLLRLRASVRNLAISILALGLFVVWAEELQTVALSLVAIAAAAAIATKELITCVAGTLYRGSMRPYSIGDRVVIGDMRGEVLDILLLATRLQELVSTPAGDVITGRVLVVPNSTLFTASVLNESAGGAFVLDTISFSSPANADWASAESRALAAAKEVTREFEAPAQAAFALAREKLGAPVRNATPQATVELAADGAILHRVYYPVPLTRRGEIRQLVWRSYLSRGPTQSTQSASDGD